MIPLLVPCLLLLALLIFVISLYIKKYRFSLCTALLMIILNWNFKVFTIGGLSYSKKTNIIKFMTWNIDGSSPNIINNINNIYETILKADPDVIFLAEDYYTCCNQLDSLLKVRYPFSTMFVPNESHYFYSKYPLGSYTWITKDVDSLSYIIKLSVIIGSEHFNIYGCHLSSNNYSSNGIRPNLINNISNLSDYITGIKTASKLREKEALVILDSIGSKKDNTIIMGDMNDLCGSISLRHFEKNGFSDAWWSKGLGYGATLQYPLLFRIDHIYYSEDLHLSNIKRIKAHNLSDHDALIAEFVIN